MSKHSRERDIHIAEEQLPAVLLRAIKLDELQRDSLTLSEVTGIAASIGVAPSAVERAAEEICGHQELDASQEAGPASRAPDDARGRAAATVGRWTIVGATLATGIGSAYGSQLGWQYPVIGIGLGGLVLLSTGLAAMVQGRRRIRLFALRNSGLWLGVGAAQVIATAFTGDIPWADILSHVVVGPVFGLWAVTSALGAGIVRLTATRGSLSAD